MPTEEIEIGEARVEEGEGEAPPPEGGCLTPKQWLSQHYNVVKATDSFAEASQCVTPSLLAKELELDQALVEAHLEAMAANRSAVKVADADGKNVYCTQGLINKFLKDLESL